VKRRELPIIDRFWLRLIAGFFAVGMLMVWEHVLAVRVTREAKDLRRETDQLTYENGRMQTQINQWISPSHLDAVARKDYGMAPLQPKQIIGIQKP
jgi:cell division protein FtsL